MRRLIAAGADVNARGKSNMTPLLWAFFDDKPERFRLLLEAMGESMAAAQADRERWGKARDLLELGEMRPKERDERKRRERDAAAATP